MKHYLLVIAIVVISGCSKSEPLVEGRWYTQTQVENGKELFLLNCATCHGAEAQGLVKDWRKSLPDGSYPPPPLNGSAHAWHHPLKMLRRTIREGGIPLGGQMPAFKNTLSDNEIYSVIAYFQSK